MRHGGLSPARCRTQQGQGVRSGRWSQHDRPSVHVQLYRQGPRRRRVCSRAAAAGRPVSAGWSRFRRRRTEGCRLSRRSAAEVRRRSTTTARRPGPDSRRRRFRARPAGAGCSPVPSAAGVTPGRRSWFGVLIDSMLESWRNPEPGAIPIGVRWDSAVAEHDSRVLDMVFSSRTCLQRRRPPRSPRRGASLTSRPGPPRPQYRTLNERREPARGGDPVRWPTADPLQPSGASAGRRPPTRRFQLAASVGPLGRPRFPLS